MLISKVQTAAAKSLQSCPTLCDPTDGSPPGSIFPGILQARTLEWVAISFSNARKWKVKVKSLSRVWLFATPWTAAHQAPLSMGFSRQEYWSGVPLPSPKVQTTCNNSCRWTLLNLENYFLLRLTHPSLKDYLQRRHPSIYKLLLVGLHWIYYQHWGPKDDYFHWIHRIGMGYTEKMIKYKKERLYTIHKSYLLSAHLCTYT